MSPWKQNEWFEKKTVCMFLGSKYLLKLRKCWEENIYVTELLRTERPACVLRFALRVGMSGLSVRSLYFWKLSKKYLSSFCRSFDVGQIYNYFSGKFISVI